MPKFSTQKMVLPLVFGSFILSVASLNIYAANATSTLRKCKDIPNISTNCDSLKLLEQYGGKKLTPNGECLYNTSYGTYEKTTIYTNGTQSCAQ